jgi:VanZ family protein
LGVRKKLNLLGLATVISIVTYFSIRPLPGTSSGGASIIPLHLIAYFVLAAAFLVNFHDTTRGHIEAVSAAFVFGLLLEMMQLNLPSRYFSFHDMGMNLLGASIILLDHRIGVVTELVEVEDRLIEKALNAL